MLGYSNGRGGSLAHRPDRGYAPGPVLATRAVSAPTRRATPLDLEAIGAVDWLASRGLEGDLGLLPAPRAGCREHLSLSTRAGSTVAVAACGLAGRAALRTARWLVREALLSVEVLLAFGEDKGGSTIAAGQSLVSHMRANSIVINRGGLSARSGRGWRLQSLHGRQRNRPSRLSIQGMWRFVHARKVVLIG